MLKQESLFIPIDREGSRLHLKRFYTDPKGAVVFMLHGAIENGRIFYSNNGRGLAPFLAGQGFDVFVADLQGKGQSTPPVSASSLHGQTDSIVTEIPAFLDKIREIRGVTRQHWIGHSWGGVLLFSHLARFAHRRNQIASLVMFGVKRSIRIFNRCKFFKINLGWNLTLPLLTKIYGFLPAVKFGFGSDNESERSFRQMREWVHPGLWIDSEDDFNYRQALRNSMLPPTLYLAGAADLCLGHVKDVVDFRKECFQDSQPLHVLGLNNGNLKDYGHIDMLTDVQAVNDHFPLVRTWLEKHK